MASYDHVGGPIITPPTSKHETSDYKIFRDFTFISYAPSPTPHTMNSFDASAILAAIKDIQARLSCMSQDVCKMSVKISRIEDGVCYSDEDEEYEEDPEPQDDGESTQPLSSNAEWPTDKVGKQDSSFGKFLPKSKKSKLMDVDD